VVADEIRVTRRAGRVDSASRSDKVAADGRFKHETRADRAHVARDRLAHVNSAAREHRISADRFGHRD